MCLNASGGIDSSRSRLYRKGVGSVRYHCPQRLEGGPVLRNAERDARLENRGFGTNEDLT